MASRGRRKRTQHKPFQRPSKPTRRATEPSDQPIEGIVAESENPAPAGGRGTLMTARREQLSYSGPVPPPQVAGGWENLVPGSANRMLTMAENQSNHRISIENKVVESNIANEKRGQVFAFILALVVIGGAIVLLYTGHDITGFGALLLALVSLVTVFVVGKKKGQQELAEKKERTKKLKKRN